MTNEEMIAICARQEETLVFEAFGASAAWELGVRIREAVGRKMEML